MTHKETFEEVEKHIKVIMEKAEKLILPEDKNEIYMRCNAILDYLNQKKNDEEDNTDNDVSFT